MSKDKTKLSKRQKTEATKQRVARMSKPHSKGTRTNKGYNP
jgi:hypothetical protein